MDGPSIKIPEAAAPSVYGDVGAFHAKFDLPHYGDGRPPNLLDDETMDFRTKFMREELREFEDAVASGNLCDALDALVDLVYVAAGTAHLMHLPFDEAWREVQRANMTKVRATGADDPASTRKSALDVVKPPNFRPPDHSRAVGDALRAGGRYDFCPGERVVATRWEKTEAGGTAARRAAARFVRWDLSTPVVAFEDRPDVAVLVEGNFALDIKPLAGRSP